MNSFFWSSGNLIAHRTTLACVCVCVCVCVFLGSRNMIVCESRVLLPQHPPSRHQTELRPEWQSECRFHANDQRAPWLCAPTTKGFTVPMMSEERELRGRAREKKGSEIEEKEGKQQTRAMQKWKEKRGRRRKKGKLKAEWLSMAERERECKNERWGTDGEKRDWGRQRWRGKGGREKEEEGTIRVKMNGELRTSGPKAS